MFGVGLLGAGNMGRVHARQLAELNSAQLVAVYDPVESAAQCTAAVVGAAVAGSAAELINSDQVAVVDICVPTPAHAELIQAAARAGKHVLCEKPLALSLQEGQAAVKACEEAGVRLMVGHTLRFSPQYTRARELLQHETVGTPTVAHTYRGGVSPKGLNDWYLEPAKTGGVFVDLAVHDIDWLMWCLGPVIRVTARSTLHTSGPENEHGVATLRFESGAVAQVTASWRDAGRFHTCFELAGDRGVMRYDSAETTALELTLPDSSPEVPKRPTVHTDNSPYRNQLRHFFQQLETGGQFRITPCEALAALDVSLAAAESARTRLPTVPKLTEGGEAAW